MSRVNSISVVSRRISSTWFVAVQEKKHFGSNNTSYVDAYDDIHLEFNMADVRFIMKGIGYYTKNPLAYSGYQWGYIIWLLEYFQGNPLAWIEGLHYLLQNFDKA